MKGKNYLLSGLIALFLLFGLIAPQAAEARDIVINATPTLDFMPATATATTCGTVDVNVRVNDVVNLTAYHLEVTYDRTKVQVVEVVNGGFLAAPGMTELYEPTNTVDDGTGTGRLLFGMAQQGTDGNPMPKSGSGNLITIRLKSKVTTGETTSLTIDGVNSILVDWPEAQSISYSVTGSAMITLQSCAPTDIALSNAAVDENKPVATVVGYLSATDPDAGDTTFTYSLSNLAGYPDNASFQIVGNALQTNAVFDYETKASYQINVRVTGPHGLTYDELFTVAVNDVNDAPVLAAIGSKSVVNAETLAFTASATDEDLPADTLTFSVKDAPATATIDSATGAFSWSPTVATDPGIYNATICVSDGALEDCETITITVTDGEAPYVLSGVAYGVAPYTNITADSTLTFTVPQGYVVSTIQFTLSEPVTIVGSNIVYLGTVPYGTMAAVDEVVTVTPYAGNEVAAQLGTFTFSIPAGSIEDQAGNALATLSASLIVTDQTAPVMELVTPAEGLITLGLDDTFVLTVDAFDLNLYSLEVDHTFEATLPEFTVYASATNPWGSPEAKAGFDLFGMTVGYDENAQKWTIDFGEVVTDTFIPGGVRFFMVLHDEADNKWGSMSPTTPENTFEYTFNVTNTLEPEITSAVTYVYSPVYNYVGDIAFDDPNNIFTATYSPAEFLAGGAMNDLARYLGALNYQDTSTVIAITYKGVVYTWNPAEPNTGSNWFNGSTSLVSVMVADYLAAPGDLVITVGDGWHTSDVTFKLLITNTLDAEIASAPSYAYDPIYTYVGTRVFDDATNIYTVTYDDVDFNPNAMYDLARYLGALHRQDGSTVTSIVYNGVTYTWSPTGTLHGSNWVDGSGNTLVSAVVAGIGSYDPAVGLVFTLADGVHTENVTFKFVILDTTAPVVTISGATDGGVAMGGDLATGYILPTTNDPDINHLLQIVATANEPLEDSYFGLYLTGATPEQIAALEAYYATKTDPYKTFLLGALDGTNPFVYIDGGSLTLVDAAQHDLDHNDVPMVVPDDFPLGTYTVQGVVKDAAGNETTVTLKLIVTGDRVAPEVVSGVAIGATGFDPVTASTGLTFTVPQGYRVDYIEITMNEAVQIVAPGIVYIEGNAYGTMSASGSVVTVTPYVGNEVAGIPGTYDFTIDAGSIKDLAGNDLTTLTATMVVEPSTIFGMTDFGMWGEAWPGAFNVGWQYVPLFETTTIANIEVGMLDADRKSIVTYTADTEQVAWQRANSYITAPPDKLSSAPFYRVYDGNPIVEGRDLDWTVIFGESFTGWSPRWGYVRVTDIYGTVVYHELEYTGPLGDLTAPVVSSATAIGVDPYTDITADGTLTFTVPQGYTVEKIDFTMSEPVTVVAGTEVTLAGVPYGLVTVSADGFTLTVTPYPGNTIANLLGPFTFVVPEEKIFDISGNPLATLSATMVVTDQTAPVMEAVIPAEGLVTLGLDDTFVLTVDAFDLNLYSLEVDHTFEATLPEFTVYASATNPWGSPEAKDGFDSFGMTVAYDENAQKWTIDFGEDVTDTFIPGGVDFFMVLHDEADNKWGSMSPTTPENTFEYTFNVTNTLEPEITSAVTYVYSPVYNYVGDIAFDDPNNIFTATYSPAEFLAGGAMNDLARYLGALNYQDTSTVITITYKGVVYTWNLAEPNTGSNWFNGSTSLVSVMVADYLAAPGDLVITVGDGWHTSDVTFKLLITNTLDDEIESAPAYVYTDYTYVGDFAFVDATNIYTVTYDDVEFNPNAMNDLARYLGALYRQYGSTVTSIVYDEVTYTWDETGTLEGSNWEDASGNTLINKIIADFQAGLIDPAVGLVLTVADGVHTENVTFKFVVLDTIDPVVTIDEATADGDPMGGNLGTGYILVTENVPTADHLLQISATVDAPLQDEYFGLYFVPGESTVTAAQLNAYYDARGVPSTPFDFLGYLKGAADGTNPFVFIKENALSLSLVDAAKHALQGQDVDMTIPDDFPVGTYVVRGNVADAAGNETIVTLKLIVVRTLAVTDADLFYGTAPTVIDQPLGGDFETGFTMTLDPMVPWYYLDTDMITANNTLANGLYPFYLSPDTTTPVFFVRVDGTSYTLVDAFLLDRDGVEMPLRINGDFVPGTYTYTGELTDIYGSSAPVSITITFNDVPYATAQSVTVVEDTPTAITLSGVDLFPGTMTYVVVTQPTHGTLSGTAPALTYTPDADFHGTDSFTFTLSDGTLTSTAATVSITVTSVLDAPTVDSTNLPGPYMVGLEQAFQVTLTNPTNGDVFTNVLARFRLENITLADIASFQYLETSLEPDQWMPLPLAQDGTGVIGDFGPAAGFPMSAPYSATSQFKVTFNTAGTYPASIVLYDVAADPDVALDSYEADVVVVADFEVTDVVLTHSVDQATWFNVPGTFTDGFEMPLLPTQEYYYFDVSTLTATRSLADGSYPFYLTETPGAEFFAYWADKGVVDGATGWQGLMWQIINGDAPMFFLNVVGTDYSLIDGLQGAPNLLRINGDYYPGAYTFTGVVEDLAGFEDEVPVEIIFNDIPVAEDQSVSVVEDTATPITLTAVDIFPGTLTFEIVTPPAYGTTVLAGDVVTYTPALDFVGEDSFSFTANDGTLTSSIGKVNITVTPVKDQVVAVDDAYETNEDTTLAVATPGVRANDIDPDNNLWTVSLVTDVQHGTLSLKGDGSFIYEPDANFYGIDTFEYQLVTYPAPQNLWTDTAIVTITVHPVMDAPTLSTDLPASIYAGYETEFGVTLDNPDYGDSFAGVRVQFRLLDTVLADITSLEYYETTTGTWMNLPLAQDGLDVIGWFGPGFGFPMPAPYTATSQFRLTMAVTGTYDYEMHLFDVVLEPDVLLASLSGSVDVLDAQIFDITDFGLWGETWPGALSLGWQYVTEFDTLDIASIEIGMLDAGRNSIVKYTADEAQVAWQRANGYITPSPDKLSSAPFYVEYNGTPIAEGRDFDWTVVFGPEFAAWDPAWGYVKVVDVNGYEEYEEIPYTGTRPDITPPTVGDAVAVGIAPYDDVTAVDMTFTVPQGYVVDTIQLTMSEPVTVLAGTEVTLAGVPYGLITVDSTGLIVTITPYAGNEVANLIGTFTFSVPAGSVKDLAGHALEEVEATLIVTNIAPVAVDDAYTVAEDGVLTVAARGVLINDTDYDPAILTAVKLTDPANGTLVLNANGSLTYTPAANFHGTDTFTYKANDGLTDSNVATVTITVNEVNDAPIAQDQSVTTPEDSALPITLVATDVDGDTLTYAIVAQPANGSVTLVGDVATYTPALDFHGTDTFTFKANDVTVDSNVATVTIMVTAVNDDPMAMDDAYETDEDTPLVVEAPGVLANDADVDQDNLASYVLTQPAHGTLQLASDGSFTYIPEPDWHGIDTFTYQLVATPGLNAPWTDEATVTISVNPVDDAPILELIEDATIPEMVEFSFTATATDADLPTQVLIFSLVGAPDGATIDAATGVFTWTPSELQGAGVYIFIVKVCDDATPALCDEQSVTLTVTEVNAAPVAQNLSVTTPEETPVDVTLVATDAENDPLTYSIVAQPAHGIVILVGTTATYTPALDFVGELSFTYKANDGLADSNIATVTITVTSVNDAPVATDDEYTMAEKETLTIAAPGVLANDIDVDADTLTAILVDTVSNGTLTLNADGSFTYIPDEYFNGTDSFTYKAKDAVLESDLAVVTIAVTPVNDWPIANDDFYEVVTGNELVKDAVEGILANDVLLDPDEEVSIQILEGPQHGILSMNDDGSFTYIPDAGYMGTDTFRYLLLSVRVNAEWSDDALVTIVVKPYMHLFLPIILR